MAMADLNANPVFAAAAAAGAGTFSQHNLPTLHPPTINGGWKDDEKIGGGGSCQHERSGGYGMHRIFEVAGTEETDLTIQCEDSVFHVHRSVLSLASPVWNRMLNGAFAESTSSIIVFEEDSPLALNYVLGILYCPEEFCQHSNPQPNQNLISRGPKAEVEAILDKYQLSGVRKCIDSIKANNKLNKSNEDKIYRLREETKRLLVEIKTLRRLVAEYQRTRGI